MDDPRKLSDEEIAACAKEALRRQLICKDCGGDQKLWHLHICDEDGGANLPLNHPMVKAACAVA